MTERSVPEPPVKTPPRRVMIFAGLGILAIIILIIIISSFSGASEGSGNVTFTKVKYDNVASNIGMNISVSGYIIMPNATDTVCFGAWPTCQLWLDDDPNKAGLGLHEVIIKVGDGPNEITTTGDLHDYQGTLLEKVTNQAFNWYHVTIIGTVTYCKNGNCTIDVLEVIKQ